MVTLHGIHDLLGCVSVGPSTPGTGPPLVCVGDYQAAAGALLPRAALGYYSAGATAETTLRENITAMDRWEEGHSYE